MRDDVYDSMTNELGFSGSTGELILFLRIYSS
uniref:Uncharacterized protein n=1 Tax=Arundo donax TaxID=35708 RepID=A0A0A9DRK0_ARUDO